MKCVQTVKDDQMRESKEKQKRHLMMTGCSVSSEFSEGYNFIICIEQNPNSLFYYYSTLV